MISYTFYLKRFKNGDLIPLIKVDHPFDELCDLSIGFVGKIDGVKEVIENIEKVISGEMELYIFGGSDFVIVGVSNEITTITSFFDDEEKLQDISTKEILKLMKDWLNYLIDFKLNLASPEKQ